MDPDILASMADGSPSRGVHPVGADGTMETINRVVTNTPEIWSQGISTHVQDLWNRTASDSLWNASAENQTIITMSSLVSLNYNLPTMIIVASVLFVVIVATAFGNFLVALALFRYRYLRTISNYLIGNLALSDFLLATTILPLSTVNECLGHWVFGQAMCNFWLLADVLYCTASIWNLCIIAFDRFTATLYPLWYREKRSTKQAAIYVFLVWIISAAICMPPLLGWNDLAKSYKYDNVTNVYHCILFDTPSYVAYSASGSFYIPLFITCFLYVRIFMVLHKRMHKMRRATKLHQSRLQNCTAKPLINNASKPADKETEITLNTTQVEGSGNTEELSSKSLFGSDSGGEEDEEDSSTQVKSDNPLVCQSSCSEAEAATGSRVLKNGTRSDATGSHGQTIAIINTSIPESEQDTSDAEKVKVAKARKPDSNKNVTLTLPSRGNSSQALLPKNGITAIKSNNGEATSATKRPGLLSMRGKTLFGQPKKKKIPSCQKRKFEQREMRATIRMAIIIACFCGMWLGFFTTYFIRGFCKNCGIPRELDALFFWLGYSNSSVNPILYTIFNEEFRKAFQKILGCYRKGPHRGRH